MHLKYNYNKFEQQGTKYIAFTRSELIHILNQLDKNDAENKTLIQLLESLISNYSA